MMTILTAIVTTAPDIEFSVQEGDFFVAEDYAKACDLNIHDMDAASIHAAQDAAGHLNPGEWLKVTHEADPVDC